MKTDCELSCRKLAARTSPVLGLVVGALAILWTAFGQAQEAQAVPSATAVPPINAASPSNQPPPVVLSPGVVEILKMVEAGVSTEVIIAYVEASPSSPPPTNQDIIAMKEHNVAEEVVKLMLKRGAAARVAAVEARHEVILRAVESRRRTSGGLDPESYDYFRAHYLQPRALASSSQRLYPYFGPYSTRGYRYGPGFTYGVPRWGRSAHRGHR